MSQFLSSMEDMPSSTLLKDAYMSRTSLSVGGEVHDSTETEELIVSFQDSTEWNKAFPSYAVGIRQRLCPYDILKFRQGDIEQSIVFLVLTWCPEGNRNDK